MCTRIPPEALEDAMIFLANEDLVARFDGFEAWNPEIVCDPWARSGVDGRVRRIHRSHNTESDEGLICLGWNRFELRHCVTSMAMLTIATRLYQPGSYAGTLSGQPGLWINVEMPNRGYDVCAVFDDPVWDVIESEQFPAMLKGINTDIRRWYEEWYDSETPGQYATVFSGKNGPTLQIMQPQGNGVWICGSRRPEIGVNQLIDHNTDGPLQVIGHLVALCTVLDHCRKAIASGILNASGA